MQFRVCTHPERLSDSQICNYARHVVQKQISVTQSRYCNASLPIFSPLSYLLDPTLTAEDSLSNLSSAPKRLAVEPNDSFNEPEACDRLVVSYHASHATHPLETAEFSSMRGDLDRRAV
jgi:hypothetical protein